MTTAPRRVNPDDLLGSAVVDAAVDALAARNRRSLVELDGEERDALLAHWRSLVLEVLTSARATIGWEDSMPEGATRGRAVIVVEDDGGTRLDTHAAFFPELDEAGGEFRGTAAQAAAVRVLMLLAGATVDPVATE
jgi:hypothetical protein